MISDFLGPQELEALGLAEVGERARVSRHAVILRPEHVHLGSDARIDAFCLLVAGDGGIRIGNRVHVSAYTSILGRGPTVIEDFCSISVRCSIFTSDDDYSGQTLVNPMVPDELRGVRDGPVHIKAHTVVGSGAVILPGVTLGPSAAVGALTLVKEDVPEFAIVAGAPMRRIGTRSAVHLDLARDLNSGTGTGPR